MAYHHPLAYLLGLEGVALLHGWAGDYDQAFIERRLAEVRQLLANDTLTNHAGVTVFRSDSVTGYRRKSVTYDNERNGLFDYDEPFVFGILDELPTGTVLDAACGTGRYAAHAAARGHRVVGVDTSPEMLDRARIRVPDAEFRVGDVHELPVADDSVDIVLCGLALTHVPELAPVMVEFARVLHPGGHLVVADVHHDLVMLGSAIEAYGPSGEPGLVAAHPHTVGDYLRAALPIGLRVRRCEEPRIGFADPPSPATADRPVAEHEWDEWPWSLMSMVPEATRAFGGLRGIGQLLNLHFELAES